MSEDTTSKRQYDYANELDKYHQDDNMVGFYDKWASEYDNLLELAGLRDISKYAAEKLLEHLPTKEPEILDIACGTGFSGLELSMKGFKIVDGVDPSKEMLLKAKEKQVYRTLFEGKITENENLEVIDNKYDGVVCIGAILLNHLNIRLALKEFIRVTKSGGFCAYTINDPTYQLNFMEAHGEVLKDKKCELMKIEQRFYFVKGGKAINCYFCLIKVI